MTKQGLFEVACIIDRSGSMGPLVESTISGFNKFLKEQKEIPGEVKLSMVLFDDEYILRYNGTSIRKVKKLDTTTFVPRGTTALYDAIGKTITDVGTKLAALKEEERPEKVVVMIITDGYENASREYTREKVFEMIKHQREKYNWEFIFLGAGQDAYAVGTSIGISSNFIANTVNSSVGNAANYCYASNVMSCVRGSKSIPVAQSTYDACLADLESGESDVSSSLTVSSTN